MIGMPMHSGWGGNGKGMLIFGGILILFGIAVSLRPEILVFLISSFFIFIGLILFSIGLRKYQRSKKSPNPVFHPEDKFWQR